MNDDAAAHPLYGRHIGSSAKKLTRTSRGVPTPQVLDTELGDTEVEPLDPHWLPLCGLA